MLKAQCLIVFLICNIPDSSCRNSLEEEESFVEFGVFRRKLYEYNRYQTASCWELIVEKPPYAHKVFEVPAEFNWLREFISNLSRMNYEYVELTQSSYEDDFGESTLPLFRNPFGEHRDALLSGFGIFHETTPAKEHFLSLRVHQRSPNQKN